MNRILIVDDDSASVALLEAYLADEDNEIRTVTESHRVQQAIVEFEPDIVLLDLHMPKPDGLEILSNLSSMRASLAIAAFEIRMHPWLTSEPSAAGSFVPWIPMPGLFRPIQRTPTRLFGPGGRL